MNLKEIIDYTYNIIDEVDYDEQIEIIVKEAINEAYFDMAKIDKRLDTAYMPVIRKVATLPENCVGIESITPNLLIGDKIIGNSIVTSNTGTLEVLYATSREALINDTDEPDLHNTLQHNLSNYACYKYFLHRKKGDIADRFLNKYMMEYNKFEQMINEQSNCVMDAVVIEY